MTEKCYREIQSHGQLGGVSPIELIVLIGFPILVAPVLTMLDLNLLLAFALDAIVYAVLRISNRLSGFEHGVISFLNFQFVWPRKLPAFPLEEHDYLRRNDRNSTKS